jgi:hypothetical protein
MGRLGHRLGDRSGNVVLAAEERIGSSNPRVSTSCSRTDEVIEQHRQGGYWPVTSFAAAQANFRFQGTAEVTSAHARNSTHHHGTVYKSSCNMQKYLSEQLFRDNATFK